MKAKTKKRGQGLVEYALIISLIALVCVGALGLFADQLGTIWNDYSTAIGNAIDKNSN